MVTHKCSCDLAVAFCRFYPFGNHGLIRYEQERAGRDLIGKAGNEHRSSFHVYGHGSYFLQVSFKIAVVFPYPAVGGVNGAGPVIFSVIPDAGGNSLLEAKGRQGRYNGGKVVVGGAFSADGGDGEDQVAHLVLLFQSSAFAQKQTGLGLDSAQQIHHRGRIRAADTKVDDGNALGGGTGHRFAASYYFDFMQLGKQVDVKLEIGQQDVLSEVFQFLSRVPGQPVFNNFFLAFHNTSQSFPAHQRIRYFCYMDTFTLEPLNFPDFSFRVRATGQSKQIYDSIRKRFVALTPEEWVRQNLLRLMVDVFAYPASRIAVERKVLVNRITQRADVVVYNGVGKPAIIAECKATSVKISEDTFLQAARYNLQLNVPFFVLTNGLEHYCMRRNGNTFDFMDALPTTEELETTL